MRNSIIMIIEVHFMNNLSIKLYHIMVNQTAINEYITCIGIYYDFFL